MVDSEGRSVVYINVTVVDPKAAIKQKVSEKVENSRLPNIMAKPAGSIASNIASSSKVAEMISKKLPEKIPRKMKQKGITSEVKEVFREGPYVVFELKVIHVDTVKLAKVQSQEVARDPWLLASWVRWFMDLIGSSNQKSLEEETLPELLHAKLPGLMDEVMGEKMKEKKLEAVPKVMSESKQARYFYGQLEAVRGTNKLNSITDEDST